jgi:hypothetical protein
MDTSPRAKVLGLAFTCRVASCRGGGAAAGRGETAASTGACTSADSTQQSKRPGHSCSVRLYEAVSGTRHAVDCTAAPCTAGPTQAAAHSPPPAPAAVTAAQPPTSHMLLARSLTVSREPLLEVGKGKPERALVTGLKPAVHTTRSASSLLLLLPPSAAAVLRSRVQRSGAPSLLAPDRLFTCRSGRGVLQCQVHVEAAGLGEERKPRCRSQGGRCHSEASCMLHCGGLP